MTIYNQYNNSPNIINFCANMQAAIAFDDSDVTQAISNYLSIATASTDGLNAWGIILGQSRVVQSGDNLTGVFGFDNGEPPATGQYPQNFDNGSFFSGNTGSSVNLNDTAYRALLQLLYFKYANNCSIASLNRIIQAYSVGRGEAYVLDGKMAVTYYFGYTLTLWEINLFTNTSCLPRPSGCQLFINGVQNGTQKKII